MIKFCNLEEKIRYIANCEFNYFFNKANVVGLGFGYKVTKGFNTFKKCIKVFVSKKISKNNLNSEDLIPSFYKGIETDVSQSGEFSICKLNKRIRPVTGGYSIGPATGINGGTMGCIVTDNHDNFILSNNHVLVYNNKLPLGTAIVQPSISDGGKSPKDIIGGLSQYIPINIGTSLNTTDCAIARILNKKNVSPKIALIGELRGIVNPTLFEKVKKVGSETELTKGTIVGLNVTITTKIEGVETIFKDQIMTSKMSNYGDSGALLVNEFNYAEGLLMTASSVTTVFNKLSNVLNKLHVLLVTH